MFEPDPVRRAGAQDDHFDIRIGHHLNPQPLVEQGWHHALKRIELREVFLAQHHNDPARYIGVQHRLYGSIKGILLGLGAEHVKLFELVYDEEHRSQVIKEDRTNFVDVRAIWFERGDRRRAQHLAQRRADKVAALNSWRCRRVQHPVHRRGDIVAAPHG